MRLPPRARLLPDRRRLHLQHGPIDLVVEAVGSPSGVAAAYGAAQSRFKTILDELCSELEQLRRPIDLEPCRLQGRVARRMHHAVLPHAIDTFITPMAAVAGAVAGEVLLAMTAAASLRRACVNNGGDIALHLAEGETLRIGLVDRPDRPSLFGSATVTGADSIRGVATSGWRGRSFSLGIADAVTVLARSAAQADAAATVIANAVDIPGHPAVTRIAACEVQSDSDLGSRLVTRAVGPLAPAEIEEALARGLACAATLAARGLIAAAALHLQGETRVAGEVAFAALSGTARMPDAGRTIGGGARAPSRLAGPGAETIARVA